VSTQAPYRHIDFGIRGVRVEQRPDGSQRVVSEPGLGPYPKRLTDRLLQWAAERPEHTFMARRGPDGAWRRISYRQALEFARRIGQALLDRGLSVERPVVILSENDLEHAMLALAAQFVGVPHAPVSPAYSTVSQDHEKLRHVMRTLTPGLVFAADGARYAKALAAAVPPEVEVVVGARPPQGRAVTLFDALAATEPTPAVDAAQQATGPDTIFKFLFTSGSTSLPKAVINTQRMTCANLQMIVEAIPALGEGPPVFVDWLPWNHTFGGNHNVGLTLFNGGTLYIDDGKPVPALFGETLRNLREIAPTVYFNVPKGFEELAAALKADPTFARHFFSRVKMLFYAGAGLAQPVWDSLMESSVAACGERIVIGTGLGMTETAPSSLFTTRADVRSGMIGLPCAGVEVKLDPNGGKLEICYRGPHVMPGYWRAPEATRQVFDDEGFFHSGDAVRFVDPADPSLGFVFDGRIAEDFKLATGTWVSVGPLRARVMAAGDPYVQDVVIAGIDRDDVRLLVFPNVQACRALAPALPADASAAQVLADAGVRGFLARLLATLVAQATGSANRPTCALLLGEPPSIDRGEITDKGSINQRAVLAHRADAVRALYDDANPALIRPA
jgi:feruloyl-CoA synthase